MALSSLYRGKWKAFSPNNLTGQWLSLAGGYAIEQVDYYPWPVLLYTSFSSAVALICIPVWDTSTLVTLPDRSCWCFAFRSGHHFTADVEDIHEDHHFCYAEQRGKRIGSHWCFTLKQMARASERG
ncbi:hypothetical protein EDD16DRAFT_1092232 [Pisolithus croceorrhizus]|nr:hypothetical protein EDD16DRAFT_1092232 [Pisolithus croceorrhizus]